MRLSLRGEYALRALIALAQSYEGEVVPMQVISERQQIPKRFLEQILNDLRAGGCVESKRGVAGGYRLARPVAEITLTDVLRHFEDFCVPMADLRKHGSEPPTEADSAQQVIRGVMQEVRAATLSVLDNVTVADLCQRAQELQPDVGIPDYAI